RIILYEETIYENTDTTEDTTDTTEEPPSDPPPDTTSDGDPVNELDQALFDEDNEVTDEYPEDAEFEEEWKAPWEGGGQEQLTGSYDQHYDEGFNMMTLAVGVLGTTGILMLLFAQMFTRKR
ncbi:MAG: hypothetical protein ACTSPB_01535, partial [Candidatus Thorarchaeota archaeon]